MASSATELTSGVTRIPTAIPADAMLKSGASVKAWIRFGLNPLEPGQTMTAAMTALAIGSDRVRGAALTFESLFFVGLLLFLITLALNLASEAFVRRVRRRY